MIEGLDPIRSLDAPAGHTGHRVVVGGAGVDERLQIEKLLVDTKMISEQRFAVHVGGGGANASLAHRLLAPEHGIALLANVGDDEDGHFVRRVLDEHGVVMPLRPVDGGSTSSSVVITEADGTATIISFSGVKNLPVALDAVERHLQEAEALCLAAHHATADLPELLRLAHARRVPVFMGVSTTQIRLGYEKLGALLAAGGGAEVVMLNMVEAAGLCRTADLERQLALLRFAGLAKLAVITRGAAGIDAAGADSTGNEGRWHEGAYVDGRPIVDTTAAGDAAQAAMVDAWVRGMGVPLALKAAARNGWEACTHWGGGRAFNREQMDAYLEKLGAGRQAA